MIRTAIVAALALACVASNAEARSRHHVIIAHERCNIDWPCEGVSASPRGEMIVKAMRGFGTAQKIYRPQDSRVRFAGCVFATNTSPVAKPGISHDPA